MNQMNVLAIFAFRGWCVSARGMSTAQPVQTGDISFAGLQNSSENG